MDAESDLLAGTQITHPEQSRFMLSLSEMFVLMVDKVATRFFFTVRFDYGKIYNEVCDKAFSSLFQKIIIQFSLTLLAPDAKDPEQGPLAKM